MNHRHQDNISTDALKIILPAAERRPCVCGATLYRTNVTRPHCEPLWLCSRRCGARGQSYQGALRRKVRLDLLSWGGLRRNAQKLIGTEPEPAGEYLLH